MNTVERNEEDYFDFDSPTALPLRGKKNANSKKSSKFHTGPRSTTKRTPATSGFGPFEFETESPRPPRLKQNFGEPQNIRIQPQQPFQPQQQQQQKGTRQQQQDFQLDQIRNFIGEQHRQYKQKQLTQRPQLLRPVEQENRDQGPILKNYFSVTRSSSTVK